MIIDALFSVIGTVLQLLADALPESTLDLPVLSDIGGWFGEYAAPLDRWFPVTETAVFLDLVVTIWMPAALAYSIAHWVYSHLPVIGAG